MRLNGFKLKERVSRVINKLIEKEINLSDVFVRRPTRGTAAGDSDDITDDVHQTKQSQIISCTMLPVDEVCKLCAEITEV